MAALVDAAVFVLLQPFPDGSPESHQPDSFVSFRFKHFPPKKLSLSNNNYQYES